MVELDELISERNTFVSQFQNKRLQLRPKLNLEEQKEPTAISPHLLSTVEELKLLEESLENFDQIVMIVLQRFLSGMDRQVTATLLARLTQRLKSRLPLLSNQAQLLERLSSPRVSVFALDGGPLWGKSVSLPQFLAEHNLIVSSAPSPSVAAQKRKVISTQPFDLLAEHVAEQIADHWGGEAVGVCTRKRSTVTADTAIDVYSEQCFLMLLCSSAQTSTSAFDPRRLRGVLDSVSYILLDHAHVRSQEFDVLFGILLSESFRCEWPHLKVVVMSSCLPPSLAKHPLFFDRDSGLARDSYIRLPSRPLTRVPIKIQDKRIPTDEQALAELILSLILHPENEAHGGTVLAYLPSISHITNCQRTLQKLLSESDYHGPVQIVPFAESVFGPQLLDTLRFDGSGLESQKPFRVILSTRFGESFFFKGVRFVLDSGVEVRDIVEPSTLLTEIRESKVSSNNSELRLNRFNSSVMKNFQCYYRSSIDLKEREEEATPCILEQRLDWVVTTLVCMGLDPYSFPWLTAPSLVSLNATIRKLSFLKAIESPWEQSPRSPSEVKAIQFQPQPFGRDFTRFHLLPEMVRVFQDCCKLGCGVDGAMLVGLMGRPSIFVVTSALVTKQSPFLDPLGDPVSYLNLFRAFLRRFDLPKLSIFSEDFDWVGVQKWCSENRVDFQSLLLAASDAKILLALPTIRDSVASQLGDLRLEEVNSVVLGGMMHNIASLLSSDNPDPKAEAHYGTLGLKQSFTSKLHPSSSLYHSYVRAKTNPPSELICFGFAGKKESSTNVSLSCCFPVTLQDIGPLNPDYAAEIYSRTLRFDRPLVLRDLPHNLFSILKKDYSCRLNEIQAKLGLEMLMDEEARELRVNLPAPRHDEVRAVLLNLLTSREAGSGSLCVQSDELLFEELIGGSVRAVFRSGGTIERFLFGREFITLNLKNVPRTVTLDRLREFGASCFTTHTPRICDVSLIFSPNQNEGALGSGRITYSNPEDAAFALGRLNNVVIDGEQRVSVLIGGIQVPEAPKAARTLASLQLVVSTRPSKGRGQIRLNKDWQRANQLYQTLRTLGLPFKIFANGSPFGQQPHPNKPLLDPHGLFLPPAEDAIPAKMFFSLNLTNLPSYFDETHILQEIKNRAAARGIRLPHLSLQSISIEKDLNTPASDLGFVSDFIRQSFPKSHLIESIAPVQANKNSSGPLASFNVKISQELNDQDKFNLIQEIASYPFPPINGLPVRFRIQFKSRISLELVFHATYQKTFSNLLDQFIRKQENPSLYKYQFEEAYNKKSYLLKLSSPSLPHLNEITATIRSFLSFSIFRSPHPSHNSLLFSQVGVRKMDTLSTQTQAFDEVPFLLKRNPFNSLVMVYHPTKSVRERVCEALGAMLGEMAASKVVFETWVSARTKQNMLKTKPRILREHPTLFNFDFQKLKLIVEGCEESIQSLREAFGERFLPNLAQAVKAPVDDNEEEETCFLCFCPYADKFTLLCGHSACKQDCLSAERAIVPPTLPARCFSCAAPYSWSDLQSLTTPQSLATNKQQAVSKFFLENPGLVRYCPLPGCNHVLDNRNIVVSPTADPDEEKRAGGNGVVYCESCSEEYCMHCSTRDSRPAEAHPGVPCHLNQSDEIRLYVLRVEDMLCKHCPRCNKVFSDFTGCFALTCESCKCGFCGYCFMDCGSDAHGHVLQCPHNLTSSYHSTMEEFNRLHAMRCDLAIPAYLSTLEPELRARVVETCRQLFIDIGMAFQG